MCVSDRVTLRKVILQGECIPLYLRDDVAFEATNGDILFATVIKQVANGSNCNLV